MGDRTATVSAVQDPWPTEPSYHSMIAPGPLIQVTHMPYLLLLEHYNTSKQQIIMNTVAQRRATNHYKYSSTKENNKSLKTQWHNRMQQIFLNTAVQPENTHTHTH